MANSALRPGDKWKHIHNIWPKNFGGQNFYQAQLPLYCRNTGKFYFFQYGKDHCLLYIITYTELRKNKFVRANESRWQNFLLVKISSYTVIEGSMSLPLTELINLTTVVVVVLPEGDGVIPLLRILWSLFTGSNEKCPIHSHSL